MRYSFEWNQLLHTILSFHKNWKNLLLPKKLEHPIFLLLPACVNKKPGKFVGKLFLVS